MVGQCKTIPEEFEILLREFPCVLAMHQLSSRLTALIAITYSLLWIPPRLPRNLCWYLDPQKRCRL